MCDDLTPEELRQDSHDSYFAAIAEIRRRGVLSGEFKATDAEKLNERNDYE